MGDHDHGHTRAGQFNHHVKDLFNHFRVQGRGGLVEEHDFRLHGQRASNGHPLLLATGELSRILMGLLGNAHALQEFHGHFFRFLLRPLEHVDGSQSYVFQHREVREQVELLEHHPHLTPDLFDVLQVVREFHAVHNDGAPLVFFQPVDAPDEGGFPRTRGSKDDHHLPGINLHTDAPQGMEVAVPLMHIPGHDDGRLVVAGMGFFAAVLWRGICRGSLAHTSPPGNRRLAHSGPGFTVHPHLKPSRFAVKYTTFRN